MGESRGDLPLWWSIQRGKASLVPYESGSPMAVGLMESFPFAGPARQVIQADAEMVCQSAEVVETGFLLPCFKTLILARRNADSFGNFHL